ncbi:GtrA family protein [Weissella diestrammenae]|uniref:GtrA family protein n=2 Tax=Weissella diestrammenae TaxID=1162633 RepID=A0A7G9T515_9LACO|nr:GtrA family protein [Weissella diestrammenae]MCM0582913.1 GtrA family protein [Weissella diestrammenae]QNN75190.1 GtrA family protein [Weissella diestrammenae]
MKKFLRDERVRFLAVGGFNTVFGFVLFALFERLLKNLSGGYMYALVIAQVISLFVAYWMHRTLTFKVKGHFWRDLFRFTMVNAVGYGINLVALPLFVNLLHMEPLIAQFIILLVTTVISYVGHKMFSFRRNQNG